MKINTWHFTVISAALPHSHVQQTATSAGAGDLQADRITLTLSPSLVCVNAPISSWLDSGGPGWVCGHCPHCLSLDLCGKTLAEGDEQIVSKPASEGSAENVWCGFGEGFSGSKRSSKCLRTAPKASVPEGCRAGQQGQGWALWRECSGTKPRSIPSPPPLNKKKPEENGGAREVGGNDKKNNIEPFYY